MYRINIQNYKKDGLSNRLCRSIRFHEGRTKTQVLSTKGRTAGQGEK